MNAKTDFLTNRKQGIGGSDIAAIIGLSNWNTPYDIWLDKRTDEIDAEETEYQYWGTVLEDVVAKEYGKRTDRKVQRVNRTMEHPEAAFARANIDRAVINPDIAGTVRWKDGRLTTDRILECKTSNAFTAHMWGEVDTDEVPDYYLVQVQWYLGITGCDVGDLAVLIGGNDYRNFTIQRDDEIISDLLEEGRKFWGLVQSGIAPDPQTMDDVKRMWQTHVPGKRLIVDVDIAAKFGRLAQISDEKKALETEEKQIKFEVCSAIEDCEEVIFEHGGDKLATFKAQTSNRIDTKALKSEHPEIADAYTKQSTTRVLRLSKAAKELAQ
jgi:putative phage-type endonuclease